jgi:hypothetical protein
MLHSKFIEIFSKSKVKKETKDSILKEWEFLPKTDAAELKNFFGKYRYLFLLDTTDTVEWYKTLLCIYSYAAISDQVVSDWRYDSNQGRYVKSPNVIKAVTENQVKNYNTAKDLLKKEKALAKKLEKKK